MNVIGPSYLSGGLGFVLLGRSGFAVIPVEIQWTVFLNFSAIIKPPTECIIPFFRKISRGDFNSHSPPFACFDRAVQGEFPKRIFFRPYGVPKPGFKIDDAEADSRLPAKFA